MFLLIFFFNLLVLPIFLVAMVCDLSEKYQEKDNDHDKRSDPFLKPNRLEYLIQMYC